MKPTTLPPLVAPSDRAVPEDPPFCLESVPSPSASAPELMDAHSIALPASGSGGYRPKKKEEKKRGIGERVGGGVGRSEGGQHNGDTQRAIEFLWYLCKKCKRMPWGALLLQGRVFFFFFPQIRSLSLFLLVVKIFIHVMLIRDSVLEEKKV